MTNNAVSSLCPHCAQVTSHTIAPSPAPAEGDSGLQVAPETTAEPCLLGFARVQLVCSGCENLWSAAVISADQLQQLKQAAQSLDEAKRQIAMLRLIMSKDQLERAEKSQRDVIKLREAA